MTSRWAARQARATALRQDHPHADELLTFYAQLVEVQASVYDGVTQAGRRQGRRFPVADRIDLEPQVAGAASDTAFRRFVGEVAPIATDLLADLAVRLTERDGAIEDVLAEVLARRPLDEVAKRLRCAPLALQFFPRAYLQPVCEALIDRRPPASPTAGGSAPAACPRCGWPPQLSLLRDDPEIKGVRLLVCSLCGHEWVFPRATCPRCGEVRSERLRHHVSDDWPHLRIEACEACQSYIKGIDLRADGRAVPVVDELAAVELDLWAADAGLEKVQRNLLGL